MVTKQLNVPELTANDTDMEAEQPDPEEVADRAGLRYVLDSRVPGIQRRRASRGFAYVGPDGAKVTDPDTLARIKSLAIPPAWTEVWICPTPDGHIQATGRDAKGRKQYRYHPHWRTVRDATKYHRMIDFCTTLPQIRERAAHDLALHGLPREKVIATVLYLLETTLIRIGNDEYARQNGSFGLTTLQDNHVDISSTRIQFRFRGKSGKEHVVDLRDRRLARIVNQCREIPGYELFQYFDDNGERRDLRSEDVNDYLREVTGRDFTAKDFRTWAGTVLTAECLYEIGETGSQTEGKRNVTQAIKSVAEQLGNTPAVCRRCYAHPAVIDAYLDGTFWQYWNDSRIKATLQEIPGLRPEEIAVLAILRGRQDDHLSADLDQAAG